MKHPRLGTVLALFIGCFMVVGCSKELSEEQILKSATLHHSSDEFDEAISDFELLVQKFPKSDKVPEALFAMGVIYLNNKKEYAKAESVYARLITDFPQHPTAQGAAYQRARIFVEHLHKPDSAVAAYELFLRLYPDAVSTASARLELKELRKKPKAAK